MRRRRSWRPSGCAYSRTTSSWNMSWPTLLRSCLRPGSAHAASASLRPGLGAPGNRCPTSEAGSPRGQGRRCRYGPVKGLLRRTRDICSKALSDKGGDAPPMITDRQRRRGVVQTVCDVASPWPGSSVQGPDRTRTATDRGLEVGRHHVAARGPGTPPDCWRPARVSTIKRDRAAVPGG